jgi:hypothetical protein
MFSSHLTIAGIDFEIGCDVDIVNSFLSDAYVEFAGNEALVHNYSIPVELLVGAKQGISKLERCFDAGDMWSLFRDGETRYVTHAGGDLESPMWCAELPLDASAIRVYCGEALALGHLATSISNPMRYPLDQILMTYALAQLEGVLLHSAGVLCEGELWLLAGKSGAGKSTCASLLRGVDGVELVSDDRIVVRKVGDEFIGYGTPWPGEARIASNRKAPLAGILFLDQAPLNQIDEIGVTDAFERLMPVASVPWYEPDLFPGVMDFCGSVAESLPMTRLQFRPDAEAAEMIVDYLAAH